MTSQQQPELIREDYGELNVIFVHSKIDDLGLSVYAFRVYAHLARRASNPSGCAWPAISTIAEVCKIGETKVREALRELEDCKMIVREARPQKSYLVRITPPSIWRHEGVVRHANPSPREPSATRTLRHANQGGSPHEPEVYPLKETRTAEEDEVAESNKREIERVPPDLVTPAFIAVWKRWVIHWCLTFNRQKQMPWATADAHMTICVKLGEVRAIAAVENAIARGLREPAEPFQQNANHRKPNPRGFEQSGEYAGITDK